MFLDRVNSSKRRVLHANLKKLEKLKEQHQVFEKDPTCYDSDYELHLMRNFGDLMFMENCAQECNFTAAAEHYRKSFYTDVRRHGDIEKEYLNAYMKVLLVTGREKDVIRLFENDFAPDAQFIKDLTVDQKDQFIIRPTKKPRRKIHAKPNSMTYMYLMIAFARLAMRTSIPKYYHHMCWAFKKISSTNSLQRSGFIYMLWKYCNRPQYALDYFFSTPLNLRESVEYDLALKCYMEVLKMKQPSQESIFDFKRLVNPKTLSLYKQTKFTSYLKSLESLKYIQMMVSYGSVPIDKKENNCIDYEKLGQIMNMNADGNSHVNNSHMWINQDVKMESEAHTFYGLIEDIMAFYTMIITNEKLVSTHKRDNQVPFFEGINAIMLNALIAEGRLSNVKKIISSPEKSLNVFGMDDNGTISKIPQNPTCFFILLLKYYSQFEGYERAQQFYNMVILPYISTRICDFSQEVIGLQICNCIMFKMLLKLDYEQDQIDNFYHRVFVEHDTNFHSNWLAVLLFLKHKIAIKETEKAKSIIQGLVQQYPTKKSLPYFVRIAYHIFMKHLALIGNLEDLKATTNEYLIRFHPNQAIDQDVIDVLRNNLSDFDEDELITGDVRYYYEFLCHVSQNSNQKALDCIFNEMLNIEKNQSLNTELALAFSKRFNLSLPVASSPASNDSYNWIEQFCCMVEDVKKIQHA